MIKFSKPSKMPCRSWSLEALKTCPGSLQEDGNLVDACKGCYATEGNYRFPNVRATRESNRTDWKRGEWVNEMIKELDNDRYFRWFDSGDVYSFALAVKLLSVMEKTPWVKHWLPTRMHKFKKFNDVLRKMEALPNVVVRRSSDSVVGDFSEVHGSTIFSMTDAIPKNIAVCPSFENDGKCGDCRKCWDKSISVVGYVAHGKKMNKIIKIVNQVH